jgi:hypothetical protein
VGDFGHELTTGPLPGPLGPPGCRQGSTGARCVRS